MSISLVNFDGIIRMRDSVTKQESAFNGNTGEKIWGNLEMSADDVLFKAWRQTQPDKLTDKQLRANWKMTGV